MVALCDEVAWPRRRAASASAARAAKATKTKVQGDRASTRTGAEHPGRQARRRFMIGKYEIIAQPIAGSAHMLRYTVFVSGRRVGATDQHAHSGSHCRYLNGRRRRRCSLSRRLPPRGGRKAPRRRSPSATCTTACLATTFPRGSRSPVLAQAKTADQQSPGNRAFFLWTRDSTAGTGTTAGRALERGQRALSRAHAGNQAAEAEAARAELELLRRQVARLKVEFTSGKR